MKRFFLTDCAFPPLTGIIGFSGLVAQVDSIDDEAKEMVHAIQREGGNLLNPIENLIDLSKIEDFSCSYDRLL